MKAYTLDDQNNPVPASDMQEVVQWLDRVGEARRIVKQEVVDDPNGESWRVSTVFLTLDHRTLGDGPPILFETMVFGGPADGEAARYCAWGEAEAGHDRHVASVRELMRIAAQLAPSEPPVALATGSIVLGSRRRALDL